MMFIKLFMTTWFDPTPSIEKMKIKKCRQVDFKVDDFVWAVLTKYRFSVGEYNKLLAKKIGPLGTVKKINSNAYRFAIANSYSLF